MRLYNTATRETSEFTPINEKMVRLYVCGPTVYDYAHIGNARPVIVFDLLFRVLRHIYGDNNVMYVRNITDVDDKIIDRAKRDYPEIPLNEAITLVTTMTNDQFQLDVSMLGCLEPTIQPRATAHIADMQSIIQKLMDRGHAYVSDGHVLFDVSSNPHRSLNRSVDASMARIEAASYKRSPEDFVLWKPSSVDEPGWDSAWGYGRPGWHIECSAMSWKYLGETFDIHGGGIDLIFPHHENEIAQSCCAFGHDRMANVWMHNGFVQLEGQKMSKSSGNFITINELLKDWSGDVLRFNMLRTHYRQPINWTVRGLEESERILSKWHDLVDDVTSAVMPENFFRAIEQDMNTPLAISHLHDHAQNDRVELLRGGLNLFGLLSKRKPKRFLDTQMIETIVQERAAKKAIRDYAGADALRSKLMEMGISIKDTKDPVSGEEKTVWEAE